MDDQEERPDTALKLIERPKDVRERLERVLAKPDILERILEHVANGGSLVTLCKHWAVSYRKVMNWINKQPDGKRLYQEALDQRLEWADEMVLSGLQEHSQANIKDLFDQNGEPLAPHELPDEIAQSVDSIKITERHTESGDRIVTRDYKLVDKLKAKDMLNRTRGKYIDKTEHTIGQKLEDILAGTWDKK